MTRESDMQGLDRHITGNWGEDWVPPDFIKVRELCDLAARQVVRIDVAPQTADRPIVATIKRVVDKGSYVSVWAEEYAYPFVMDKDMTVFFANEDEV
jgi:hypothetical protein